MNESLEAIRRLLSERDSAVVTPGQARDIADQDFIDGVRAIIVADSNYRQATEDEVSGWLSGALAIDGAVETEHGLLVPE